MLRTLEGDGPQYQSCGRRWQACAYATLGIAYDHREVGTRTMGGLGVCSAWNVPETDGL